MGKGKESGRGEGEREREREREGGRQKERYREGTGRGGGGESERSQREKEDGGTDREGEPGEQRRNEIVEETRFRQTSRQTERNREPVLPHGRSVSCYTVPLFK